MISIWRRAERLGPQLLVRPKLCCKVLLESILAFYSDVLPKCILVVAISKTIALLARCSSNAS